MSRTYPAIDYVDNMATFSKPAMDIIAEVPRGGGLVVQTRAEYISDQQRKWYKGVCLPHLVKNDENKNSKDWWDIEVKKKCNGLGLLKKQVFFTETFDGQLVSMGRLTIADVGRKNMSEFINEILAKSVEEKWGLVDPDAELRKD